MASTWIESAAKGRNGGPVRAGVWASVVIGTHPVEPGQHVWLEITADDIPLGPIPAHWVENRGVNSLWHVPIPPQGVGTRLHYRSIAQSASIGTIFSPYQDTIVRPNLPDRTETPEIVSIWPEGLVGNRMMTVRVDDRGSTQDIYYPTVGLHSNVRPAEGDLPQSRCHFRAIVGGLAIGSRLDWFNERLAWNVFQNYQGATNILRTELTWRRGPIRVVVTDFAAMGGSLPKSAGAAESPGQYLKRFRIENRGSQPLDALFGVYVDSEVNGGIGEPGLSWDDSARALLAINRGHSHVNRKLARDATIEFAVALDNAGEVHCEPTGPNQAVLLRQVHLPAGGEVSLGLIVSAAFTGWRGDPGTFQHWIQPALQWFRSSDLDQIEQAAAQEWDSFVDPLPNLSFPKPEYAVALRRSALACAIHSDAKYGAIASGFDRGLNAYCWPREAVWVGDTLSRAGHPAIGQNVYKWLASVRGLDQTYSYWFQKYSIDGQPEWETPAIDQTAMIPWGIERIYRRHGDLSWVAANWPVIERAVGVCTGSSGHPGLSWVDDLSLMRSAGIWDSRFGAFLYSNACLVAGLRSAARLAQALGKAVPSESWLELADRVLQKGILSEVGEAEPGPGLVDGSSGRFLEARRVSKLRGMWADHPSHWLEHSNAVDVSLLGIVVPFGLIPATDERIRRTIDEIFRRNSLSHRSHLLTRWVGEASRTYSEDAPANATIQDISSFASLWMSRYLIRFGRETGEVRYWDMAVTMIDGILARLGPLGLSLRAIPRSLDAVESYGGNSGALNLHAMIIDTLQDLAGLEYDAVDQTLFLQPALPSSWPSVGVTQKLPCGEVSYQLERAIGGHLHRLHLRGTLRHEIKLAAQIICPGLQRLGPWDDGLGSAPPKHDIRTGRVSWTTTLPAGAIDRIWTWG